MTTNPAADPTPRRGPGRPRHETPSTEFVQRRESIIDTASEVFKQRGYDAGSLDDVAAALGLRKSSLYYYVRSKAELLYFVFDRAISRALERLETLMSTNESPRQRLEALIRHQVMVVSDDPSLFTVFFDQRPHLDDEYETEIQKKERRYLRLYAQGITDAAEAGVLIHIDPRYAAQLVLGMTSWTYKWFDRSRDNADDLADAAVQLILGSHGTG